MIDRAEFPVQRNNTLNGRSLIAASRLHVHVAVDDLQRSIGFYSELFAAKPSVTINRRGL